MKKYSKINKISNSTIRRYFLPPKNNIQSSKFYKSHILAKIPQKRNSKSIKEHCDFHFTCALVNYVEELSSLYNDEILALSCDNKAKIPLGAPAVSRYVRSRKFHLVEKQPNLPDHDFPRHGIRINPSAYAVLSNQRKRSSSIDSHPSCELKVKKRSRSCDDRLFPDIKYDTNMRAYAILFGERNLYPDEHLLSGPKVTCSKCKLPYVFLSKADEERHNQWIHAPTQELKRSSTGVNKIVKRRRSLPPEY
ncbi:unnamed protein product [Rotaria socialis]|uniref:C2H2-type domain-containing protein n=1 Tax=Rotaria socialis TaxID=392032 RepID=A0A817RM49_9BILA|nr:unnamed protein product [Rotaria socialis]